VHAQKRKTKVHYVLVRARGLVTFNLLGHGQNHAFVFQLLPFDFCIAFVTLLPLVLV